MPTSLTNEYVQEVQARKGIDAERFSQDVQYRRESLLALAETVEVSGLAEAIKSAEQFGVGIYEASGGTCFKR